MSRISTDLDDAGLLAIYCDGAEVALRDEAFAMLVARHGAMVAATCRRWLSGSEADDAVQAVFVVLARKAGEIRVGAALPGWLHQTAWNIAQRAASAARARRIHETRAAQEAAAMTSPAATAQPECDLDAALVRLPEAYRAPLVLHYFEGLPQAAVARRLGLRENTVAMRLSRGRTMLREHLERLGAPAAALGLYLIAAPPLSTAEHAGLDQLAAAVRAGTVPGRIETLTAGAGATAAGTAGGLAMLGAALALSVLATGAWLAFAPAPSAPTVPAPAASSAAPAGWEADVPGHPTSLSADAEGQVWTAGGSDIKGFAPDGTPLPSMPNPEGWSILAATGPASRLLLLGARNGGDSVLRAVDVRSGAELWRRSWPLAADAHGSWLPRAVAVPEDGTILVAIATGPAGPAHVLHLDAAGRELWSRTLAGRTLANRLIADRSGAGWCGWTDGRADAWTADGRDRWSVQIDGGILALATLDDGSVVIGSQRSIDPVQLLQAVAADDEAALSRLDNGQLTRVGPDGVIRWQVQVGSMPTVLARHPAGLLYGAVRQIDSSAWDRPPAAGDGVVGGWCALVGDDGTPRWRHDLRGPPVGLQVHAGGMVSVASLDGRLTSLDADGVLLAERDLGRRLSGPLADRHGRSILLADPRDTGAPSRLLVLADGWWRTAGTSF